MRHTSLLFLALSTLLVACDKPVETTSLPRPALVMKVTASAPDEAMSLVGEVKARYESAQSFRIAGKITNRLVDVGATVKKGQVIARLDPVDTQLNKEAADSQVSSAQASYHLALAEVNRQRQLFVKKFISASALDVKESELKVASARLAQVEAQAQLAVKQAEYTTLTADRDGVVSFIQAEPGQVIKAGDSIVRIADTQSAEVMVAVPESRLAEVSLHAPVLLKMWSDRQKLYNGLVREIAPAADPATRTFEVRISILNADNAVKLGMTAKVKFHLANASNNSYLLIPSAALTANNGQNQVWVVDSENRVQTRNVETGTFREDGVLVHKGLTLGETIVIAGVHTLNQNQQIRPVTEAIHE